MTKAPILKDYEAGLTIEELRKKYHLQSRAGVYYKLKEAGYEPDRITRVPSADQKLVCQLWAKFRSQAKIVNATGFNKQKVSRLVKKCKQPEAP